MADKLVFVHLSDIHFQEWSGTSIHDRDAEIRHELIASVPDILEEIGTPTGVLVTGDIAFSGAKAEYEAALGWLDMLCHRLGCGSGSVWVVPGNHDVDMTAVRASKLVRALHSQIGGREADEVDDELREILTDPSCGEALLSPLRNYIWFADKFRCGVTAAKPFWESGPLELGNDRYLVLKGLTSVLTSTTADRQGSLVVGSAQAQVLRKPNVDYLTLCHHPPDWLKDRDTFTSILEANVQVQLFGHKHSQRVQKIGGGARLTAGAMHPVRQEKRWTPMYNILGFRPLTNGQIQLRIYPLQWDEAARRFVPVVSAGTRNLWEELRWPQISDGGLVPREAFSIAPPSQLASVAAEQILDTKVDEEEGVMPSEEPMAGLPGKSITYMFVSLPFSRQIAVAQKFSLLIDSDPVLSDTRLLDVVYARAAAKNLLDELTAEIETQYAQLPRRAIS